MADKADKQTDAERAKRFVDDGTDFLTITPPKDGTKEETPAEKKKRLADAVKKVVKK